jgi:hypothetical protein
VASDVGCGVQGSISLKALLRQPLKAWEGHWGSHDTPAGWWSLSEGDDCFDETLLGDYEVARMGKIIDAWAIVVDGKITEVIECWGATFSPWDLYCMGCQPDAECQTFYRYHVDKSLEGRVYPHLEQAARAEGRRFGGSGAQGGPRLGLELG